MRPYAVIVQDIRFLTTEFVILIVQLELIWSMGVAFLVLRDKFGMEMHVSQIHHSVRTG